MQQSKWFDFKGKDNLVCKLKKSLYRLKQAPRKWYKKFDSFMMSHGYNRTTYGHCVFIRKFFDDDFIFYLLYVDDMLIIGHDSSKIDRLKRELSKYFAMKDLGSVKQILGMKICHDRKNRKLWLSQEIYIEKVLKRLNRSKAKKICSLCDAPKPEGPLTTRQPRNIHFRKSGRVSFIRGALPKYNTCIYMSQTVQYMQYISNTATWAHKQYSLKISQL